MSNVFELLDRDWQRLCRSRSATRRLSDALRVAGSATDLEDLERFVRRASPPDADGVLLALVTQVVQPAGTAPGREPHQWSPRDADLAARVLLQLLLPGTRNLARRWWALGDPDERAAAAVSAVYHRIRRYPLARRPGRVAANILMDAERELRQAVISSPHTVQEHEMHDHDLFPIARADREAADPFPLDGSLPNPAFELVAVLRDAADAGVIERQDAELVARSRIAGQRIADLATGRGLRPRTLWERRHRAEQALVDAHAGTRSSG